MTLFLAAWTLVHATAQPGEDSAAVELPAHRTVGVKPFTAASSQTIRDRDLATRTILKPADLIKVTPGLFVGQHAGGGKANQYFLRGFDIDHGTDLALWVDDLPVNMVSHGHGQGYADLHFVIPELYDRVEVQKGPYAAEYGDFATAGAVRMRSRERFDESSAEYRLGAWNTHRLLGIYTAPEAAGSPVLAAEILRDDGPFVNPEKLERYNLFWRNTLAADPSLRADLTLMSYGSGWNGSGQIPLRAVEDGSLDRFGAIDPTEGGNTQRHSAMLRASGLAGTGADWDLSAYLIRYDFSLYSNFTFFAEDTINGDQFVQTDHRSIAGFRAGARETRELFGLRWNTSVGASLRADQVENTLGPTVERKRIGQTVDARVRQSSLGLYVQEDVSVRPWLRLVGGARADYFGFNVEDRLENLSDSAGRSSGVRSAAQISPKASLVIGPFHNTEFYLNYGHGFHSNDARGVVRRPDAVTPLARAVGYEAGVRSTLLPRIEIAASAWRLDIGSELVWIGDEGTTEASSATERMGVDFEARAQILPWLFADADITRSRAGYPGSGEVVALAPTFTMTGGLSAERGGVRAGIRIQHLADRAATEDESMTAEGFTVVEASLAYRWRNLEARVDVANLLDTEWREAQFANESRLRIEPAPVEDIHLVPGTPRQVQVALRMFF
jgi:outer membrane receptor protein involved in Fe transport